LRGGVGKPTFEIIGPAINIAQQTEQHVIPMAIHVSRAVHEVIYDEVFVVKERETRGKKIGRTVSTVMKQ
jgi:class 3 adenylate cyclase